ncbi:SHOCT domain-containing protein [Gaetbulibacter sp. M240]|uniref:SHOCT domain-containing protein n=1 Tax=Gaetbulibacter sp. M240 TaxID=3126511 RepID=UPI00374F9180
MKKKNRILDTILTIFFAFILSSGLKFIHFMSQPRYIRDSYHSFLSYPGTGGIFSIAIWCGAILLLFKIWKKSKEERLLSVGKTEEVEKVKKLFKEGLLTENEVNKKFDFLLNELKKDQEEINNEAEIKRKNELINQLSELKEKGLLTETEFNTKKEMVLSSKKSSLD